MSLDTVAAIARFIRRLRLQESTIPLVWHAGEPLTVPVTFYDAAIAHFSDTDEPLAVRQHLQTNATLIDAAWCTFFKRRNVHVGVSIDGPGWLHDRHRVDRRGRGTFERTLRGISLLQEHGVPFTALAVVTADAIAAPDEIYAFFRQLGVAHVGFNVEEAEGAHTSSSLRDPSLEEGVRRFWESMAALEARHGTPVVRELDDMRRHLRAPPGAVVKRANNRPGAILNVDYEGNITTLSPELLGTTHVRYGRFAWGNVHRDSFDDVVSCQSFRRAFRDIAAGVARCEASCGYFAVCGGGNPSNKLAEHDTFDSTETTYCRLHVKAVADVVMHNVVSKSVVEPAQGATH